MTIVGSSRLKENVGTGDGTTTRFYLDNSCVIDSSYNLYYGASATAALTALTESTHYTIDKDLGAIDLTGSGTAAVSTADIFAAYAYNSELITNTQLQNALNRAQAEIDDKINSHFADGSTATPDYIQVTNEKHDGKGQTDRDYYLEKYPIPNVSSTTSAYTASGASTVEITSTSGFLSSGIVGIGSDKITYTSKGSTAIYGCSGISSAHATSEYVYPFVCEISTTSSGTEPTWTVLSKDSDFDLDLESGRVHIYTTDYDLTYYALQYPPRLTPNRFRMSYIYGRDEIYDDIKRLCLMIAAKELQHQIVRKSHIIGQNDFQPQVIDVDEEWIKDTIGRYANYLASNI